MTAQHPDRAFYQGEEYSIIGASGEGLVVPQQFGMNPVALTTACWRGFVCTYRVHERLVLQELEVHTDTEDAPEINGVAPRVAVPYTVYENLNLPLEFCGKLRLASGFIEELYVHMGFQKASAFETVIDMTFDSGRLTEVHDRSAEVEAIRGQFREGYDDMEIIRRIEEAFSMDMDLR